MWVNNDATMDMSTGVVIGNSLYGFSPRNSGQYFAIDANTGQTQWLSEPRQGENAAVVRAGDLWFALDTEAELEVARANPKQFEILKRYDRCRQRHLGAAGVVGTARLHQRPVDDLALDAELRPVKQLPRPLSYRTAAWRRHGTRTLDGERLQP